MITLPCSFALSRTPPPPPSPIPKKEIKDGKWLYIHHCSKKTCTEFPKSLKFTSTRLKLLFISVF